MEIGIAWHENILNIKYIGDNEGEDIEVSHIPLPPHCVASPVFNIPYQSGTFIATDELHSHIIIIQSP